MQIEMYQHAFQISSIEVYCIWLERGLRRLRAIWIVTEGKCTMRLAFPMFSALDRCVGTVSWTAALFWLKAYCLNLTEHFLNTVPVNCFTQQKSKVNGHFCLPHSVSISLACELSPAGVVDHATICLTFLGRLSWSIKEDGGLAQVAAGNGCDRLSKAFTWCCDMFLLSQERHHTPDCRLLKGPIAESSCSLNSSQQLK